jgi:hypothetical protein
MMGMAVGAREEVFRINCPKGFCEFCFTGACTIASLTLIFKTLVPYWPMIIDFKASGDVSNVVELPALTTWEPGQDLSHNTLELNLPQNC